MNNDNKSNMATPVRERGGGLKPPSSIKANIESKLLKDIKGKIESETKQITKPSTSGSTPLRS